MKHIQFIAASVITATSLSVNASLLTVKGGNDEPISDDNDFFYSPYIDNKKQYNIGGNVLAGDSDVSLTYTFLNADAHYDNTFDTANGMLNNNEGSAGNTIGGTAEAGSLLDFTFHANAGNSGSIANGENVSNDWVDGVVDDEMGDGGYAVPSFATILDITYGGAFYDAIVMFDDSGAGPDDNHDDMVVGIQAIAIPEPALLTLFGIGLLGLGLARRRV